MDDLFRFHKTKIYGPSYYIKKRMDSLHKNLNKRNREFAKLYNAANKMMAELGANGEVNTMDSCVLNVMDVLHDIDGGKFVEMDEG